MELTQQYPRRCAVTCIDFALKTTAVVCAAIVGAARAGAARANIARLRAAASLYMQKMFARENRILPLRLADEPAETRRMRAERGRRLTAALSAEDALAFAFLRSYVAGLHV